MSKIYMTFDFLVPLLLTRFTVAGFSNFRDHEAVNRVSPSHATIQHEKFSIEINDREIVRALWYESLPVQCVEQLKAERLVVGCCRDVPGNYPFSSNISPALFDRQMNFHSDHGVFFSSRIPFDLPLLFMRRLLICNRH